MWGSDGEVDGLGGGATPTDWAFDRLSVDWQGLALSRVHRPRGLKRHNCWDTFEHPRGPRGGDPI